jgi:hypothetical protein
MKEHEKKKRGCFTPLSELFKEYSEDILLQYYIKIPIPLRLLSTVKDAACFLL